MAISEKWIPIITEGVSWVKNNLGSSKRELKVKISDLEKQVQTLVSGNIALTNCLELIVQAILKQLEMDRNYSINADTIILVGENTGSINVTKSMISNSYMFGDVVEKKQVAEIDVSKIFDGLDEEIAHSRATKQSDRR